MIKIKPVPSRHLQRRVYASAIWLWLDSEWHRTAFSRRPFSYNRFAFRLPGELPLIVSRVRFKSPGLLEIATITGLGINGLLALLRCFDKIANWPLNRKKLRLEVEKLERERPEQIGPRWIEPYFDIPPIRGAIKQLNDNPLKPNNITVIFDGGPDR